MPQTHDQETTSELIMGLPVVIDMDRHEQHAFHQRLRDQSTVELDRIYAELTTQT